MGVEVSKKKYFVRVIFCSAHPRMGKRSLTGAYYNHRDKSGAYHIGKHTHRTRLTCILIVGIVHAGLQKVNWSLVDCPTTRFNFNP